MTFLPSLKSEHIKPGKFPLWSSRTGQFATSMTNRAPWAQAFFEQGISRDDMMAMSDAEFASTCEFLSNAGLAPHGVDLPLASPSDDPELQAAIEASLALASASSQPKPEQPKQPERPKPEPAKPAPAKPSNPGRALPGRTVSSQLRYQQNQEYEDAQREALEREFQEQQRLAMEKSAQEAREKMEREQAAQQANQRQARRREMQERAKRLPPEPADGVQIAFNMPSKARIMRKFDKTRPCEDLFVFVEAADEMFDENDEPREYVLAQGPSTLVREKTLEEQGITRRTLVNVVLD